MSAPSKEQIPAAETEVSLKSESDIRAYASLVLPSNITVTSSSTPFPGVVELHCTLSSAKKASRFSRDLWFSIFFFVKPQSDEEFTKLFIKKYFQKRKEGEFAGKKGWSLYHEDHETSVELGITPQAKVANLTYSLFTIFPGSTAVSKAFDEVREVFSKNSFHLEFAERAFKFTPTWLGPLVFAGIFAALAVMMLFIKKPVYHLGLTATAGIPNVAMAIFFGVLGALGLIRHVSMAYLFLLFTELFTLIQIILGALFQLQSTAWGLSSGFIALCTLFLIIWVPVRRHDFKIHSMYEFLKTVTFR